MKVAQITIMADDDHLGILALSARDTRMRWHICRLEPLLGQDGYYEDYQEDIAQ
jgi:hypothetical protein